MFLVCHVISQNHVIIWSFDFMGKRNSRLFCLFLCHRYCGSGDIMILVCNVISQDHMTKGSSNIMGGSS